MKAIDKFLEACDQYSAAIRAYRWADHLAQQAEWNRDTYHSEEAIAFRQAAADRDAAWGAVEKAADPAAKALSDAGSDPVAVFAVLEASRCDAFADALKASRPVLRAAKAASDEVIKGPKKPSDMETDTYKVYHAVEAYLMQQGDVTKVKQDHIHRAAKSLLDDVIDREEIGVGEGYQVPPNFAAFVKAYRRARNLLAAT